ncbi:type II toxin-antitoxin system YafQ family toxin [Bifidobacterium tsurumiense]|uniref:type II toxin-antitoxin system RelE/ParE family toxin n=1 Tax=Bifidobacterium tsurumiense TaxID=356829 RepID=UPI0012B272EB|nr:type II toxin-antitoxin system YafQ family toxin [Bifidobacterium tsurumiense]MSS12623.1 type II toxin-antitoxin system YafQ family toxin [Bifidobacterium tsurumiense]
MSTIYKIATISAFTRGLKYLKRKNHRDMSLLAEPVELLRQGKTEEMIRRYRDHALTGNWSGFREFHVQADWLVIYFLAEDKVTFALTRTSTHDDLYRNADRTTIQSYRKALSQ